MFDDSIENASLRILSLGAGVQSSVMALMAAQGEIGFNARCCDICRYSMGTRTSL